MLNDSQPNFNAFTQLFVKKLTLCEMCLKRLQIKALTTLLDFTNDLQHC